MDEWGIEEELDLLEEYLESVEASVRFIKQKYQELKNKLEDDRK